MRILSLGDIHGSTEWKDIINLNLGQDLTIFIGDYVDHWTYSNNQIHNNLVEIIQFKKDNPEKVILLWGNHDLQYLYNYKTHGCSGFRPEAFYDLHDLFNKNKELFQAAYQYKKYLWTHAGISTAWKAIFENSVYIPKNRSKITANNLNKEFFIGGIYSCLYDVGKKRGGWNAVGSIFWADRSETYTHYIEGIHQIVGHTKIDKIEKFGDEKGSIRYIDVFENKDLNIKDKYYLLNTK